MPSTHIGYRAPLLAPESLGVLARVDVVEERGDVNGLRGWLGGGILVRGL